MAQGNQTQWIVVVALALVLGVALYPRGEPPDRTENALRPPVSTLDPPAGASSTASTPSVAIAAPAPGSAPSPASSSASASSVQERATPPLDARAAARRQRVLDALAKADATKTGGAPGAAGSGARVYAEGTMADKTGNFGEGVRVLNRDFIPLVDECYERARERDPRLGGMLALSVKIANAESVGGIIESVEPTSGNEVHDEELLECVRQSAFSVELPESATSGRNDVQLTIPLDSPPADAGSTKAP